jgi:hypothetical protein
VHETPAAARGLEDLGHVVDQARHHAHRARGGDQLQDGLLPQHGLERRQRPFAARVGLHAPIVLARGEADRGAQGEAIELRLRQQPGALELRGVLRGDHQEGPRQGLGHAVERDLPVAHGLQRRRLRARRRAVELVGQQHVREDRAAAQLEGLRIGRRPHAQTEPVRWQQVAGELHACEASADRARQRLGQRGLARPRHVLEQHASLGQEVHQARLDHHALAAQRALDVGDQATQGRPGGRARRARTGRGSLAGIRGALRGSRPA